MNPFAAANARDVMKPVPIGARRPGKEWLVIVNLLFVFVHQLAHFRSSAFFGSGAGDLSGTVGSPPSLYPLRNSALPTSRLPSPQRPVLAPGANCQGEVVTSMQSSVKHPEEFPSKTVQRPVGSVAVSG